ncbi:MAG: hypothetical protein EBY57_06380 [Actinobacteria bacterium]|nr:hypothetical protein [Actinomycetota bacterium]
MRTVYDFGVLRRLAYALFLVLAIAACSSSPEVLPETLNAVSTTQRATSTPLAVEKEPTLTSSTQSPTSIVATSTTEDSATTSTSSATAPPDDEMFIGVSGYPGDECPTIQYVDVFHRNEFGIPTLKLWIDGVPVDREIEFVQFERMVDRNGAMFSQRGYFELVMEENVDPTIEPGRYKVRAEVSDDVNTDSIEFGVGVEVCDG